MKLAPIFCFLLFLAVISASSNTVRLPIKKRSKERRSPKTPFLNLNSFAGSMDISDYQDLEYYASIKLGSDSQEFSFQLDTGSCILWIPDSTMTNQVSSTFSCSSSSTCKETTNQISLVYGKGSVVGYQATDQIKLGDLTIPSFDIVLAETVNDMQLLEFNGLIGLGLGRNYNFPTVLESLKLNNLISVGTFSLYLGNDPTSADSTTGEIIFGGYNPEYAASSFQYVNVYPANQSFYWAADLVAVGYGRSQNLSSGPQVAIFDSGTSFMYLSQDIYDGLMSEASSKGISFTEDFYTGLQVCDCSAQNKLDNLTFYFEGATFNISASNYIISGSQYCYLGIALQEGGISLSNPMILGDTFLSNYYAMFTADNCTVGLADPAPIPRFPAWAIVLIVIGALALIALGVYLYKRIKSRKGKVTSSNASAATGVLIGGS